LVLPSRTFFAVSASRMLRSMTLSWRKCVTYAWTDLRRAEFSSPFADLTLAAAALKWSRERGKLRIQKKRKKKKEQTSSDLTSFKAKAVASL